MKPVVTRYAMILFVGRRKEARAGRTIPWRRCCDVWWILKRKWQELCRSYQNVSCDKFHLDVILKIITKNCSSHSCTVTSCLIHLGGGRSTPWKFESLSWVMLRTPRNPYLISDENMCFSLSYFRPAKELFWFA